DDDNIAVDKSGDVLLCEEPAYTAQWDFEGDCLQVSVVRRFFSDHFPTVQENDRRRWFEEQLVQIAVPHSRDAAEMGVFSCGLSIDGGLDVGSSAAANGKNPD